MDKQPCVYILSNKARTVLYIGVTSNLRQRLWQHRQGLVDSFSSRYLTHDLVYFGTTDDIRSAIEREKRLKRWRRSWKNQLISQFNPPWCDLSARWV